MFRSTVHMSRNALVPQIHSTGRWLMKAVRYCFLASCIVLNSVAGQTEVSKRLPSRVVLSLSLKDCISCISELSMWNELHRHFGGAVRFTLFIQTDRKNDISAKFRKEYKIDFDVRQDPNGDLIRSLGFSHTPSVRIFDRKGKTRYARNLDEPMSNYKQELGLITRTLDQLVAEFDSITLVNSYQIGPDEIGRVVVARCPIQFSPLLKQYVLCDDLFNKLYLVDDNGHIRKVLSKESLGVVPAEFVHGPLAACFMDSLVIAVIHRFEGAAVQKPYISLVAINHLGGSPSFVLCLKDTNPSFAPIIRGGKDKDLLYVGLDLSSVLPTNQEASFVRVISRSADPVARDHVESPDSLYFKGYVPPYYCEPRFDLDRDGNLYVIQPVSYKISKYNRELRFVSQFGVAPPHFRIGIPLNHELSDKEEVSFFDSSMFFRSILCGEDDFIYQGYTEKVDGHYQVAYQIYSREGVFVSRFVAPHTPLDGQLARVNSASDLFFVMENEKGYSIRQYRIR